MTFKLNVNDFDGQSIQSVVDIVNKAYKKPLSELSLFDLLLNETTNEALRHGVYMFFNDKNECLYVGKVSSSHFAHRIGGHFAMSPHYGMNDFLKRTVKMLSPKANKDEVYVYEDYVEVLPKISNYGVLIINANKKKEVYIRSLEKLFHIAYLPELNYPKGFPKKYKNLNTDPEFLHSLVGCEPDKKAF
jgi:hypothetical protein